MAEHIGVIVPAVRSILSVIVDYVIFNDQVEVFADENSLHVTTRMCAPIVNYDIVA